MVQILSIIRWCAENKTYNSTYIFAHDALKFFKWKLCLLYNFKMVIDIFMKNWYNFKPLQTVCREEEL